MNLRGLCAVAICALPQILGAATNGEEDTLVITPLNATDFEVVESRQMGPADFWCAAATFVERRSGRSETTPIYLKRARGPSVTQPGENGVIFSYSDAGLPPGDSARLTVTVTEPGATLKSAQGRRFCRDAFTRSTK